MHIHVHMGGHAPTCAIKGQECCSEFADQEICRAEQDLRQPRVSSSSRFKIFFFSSLSNFLPVLTASTLKSELRDRGTPDRDVNHIECKLKSWGSGGGSRWAPRTGDSPFQCILFLEGQFLFKTNFMIRMYSEAAGTVLQRRGSQSQEW